MSDRLEQDFDVECDRPMIDVPHVQLALVVPMQIVPAVDLSPAGDARQNVMTARLLGGIALEVLHQQWTRPYEAHLTTGDVPELGQFVQAAGAQPAAQARDTLGVR